MVCVRVSVEGADVDMPALATTMWPVVLSALVCVVATATQAPSSPPPDPSPPVPPTVDMAAIRDAMAISYYPSRREQPAKLEEVSVTRPRTCMYILQ